jgi:hypothetical protein
MGLVEKYGIVPYCLHFFPMLLIILIKQHSCSFISSPFCPFFISFLYTRIVFLLFSPIRFWNHIHTPPLPPPRLGIGYFQDIDPSGQAKFIEHCVAFL